MAPTAYLVLGHDAPDAEDELLRMADAHWDYIDRFSASLIARGPILSADGEAHLGSVHVIVAGSASEARRFADEEPYRRAGLYASVSVERFEDLLGQSMWERAPATAPAESTFVRAAWPACPCSSEQVTRLREAAGTDLRWAFLGLLLGDDGRCAGLAGAIDLPPAPAETALRSLLRNAEWDAASVQAARWRRGGRPAGRQRSSGGPASPPP